MVMPAGITVSTSASPDGPARRLRSAVVTADDPSATPACGVAGWAAAVCAGGAPPGWVGAAVATTTASFSDVAVGGAVVAGTAVAIGAGGGVVAPISST